MSFSDWITGWIVIFIIIGIIYVISSGVSFVSEVLTPPPSAEELEIGAKDVSLKYTLNGRDGIIQTTLYEGVNEYLMEKEPKGGQYQEVFSNEIQDKYTADLISKIKAVSDDPDDQARVAISIAQQITYSKGFDIFTVNYPYKRIYYSWGDCSQKSILLAYLLKQLGYGTALLIFEEEEHMAVGIATSEKYSYRNTGYAFVEAAVPFIITDASGKYGENKTKLESMPEVVVVSKGREMTDFDQDAHNAEFMRSLEGKGKYLNEKDYSMYVTIRDRYGLDKGQILDFSKPLELPSVPTVPTVPTIRTLPSLPPPPPGYNPS